MYAFFFQYNISPELLQRMMEAREIFLEDDIRPPFASIKQVTNNLPNPFFLHLSLIYIFLILEVCLEMVLSASKLKFMYLLKASNFISKQGFFDFVSKQSWK